MGSKTPEEVALEGMEARLAGLVDHLAGLEADFADAEAGYQRFIVSVGTKLADLLSERARLDVEIAQCLQEHDPTDADLETWRRLKVEEAADLEGARIGLPARSEPLEYNDSPRDPALRDLYRQAAKRFHPDLATDDTDRARRTQLMAELNALNAAGDVVGMRRLLEREDASPEAITGEDSGSRIVRALRKIALVESRIAELEWAIVALAERPLWDLHAEAKGNPGVLVDLEARLRADIEERRRQIAVLRGR